MANITHDIGNPQNFKQPTCCAARSSNNHPGLTEVITIRIAIAVFVHHGKVSTTPQARGENHQQVQKRCLGGKTHLSSINQEEKARQQTLRHHSTRQSNANTIRRTVFCFHLRKGSPAYDGGEMTSEQSCVGKVP